MFFIVLITLLLFISIGAGVWYATRGVSVPEVPEIPVVQAVPEGNWELQMGKINNDKILAGIKLQNAKRDFENAKKNNSAIINSANTMISETEQSNLRELEKRINSINQNEKTYNKILNERSNGTTMATMNSQGSSCINNSNCLNGLFCNKETGKCDIKRNSGNNCRYNYECSTGYCNKGTSKCGNVKSGLFEKCITNENCDSGLACYNGICDSKSNPSLCSSGNAKYFPNTGNNFCIYSNVGNCSLPFTTKLKLSDNSYRYYKPGTNYHIVNGTVIKGCIDSVLASRNLKQSDLSDPNKTAGLTIAFSDSSKGTKFVQLEPESICKGKPDAPGLPGWCLFNRTNNHNECYGKPVKAYNKLNSVTPSGSLYNPTYDVDYDPNYNEVIPPKGYLGTLGYDFNNKSSMPQGVAWFRSAWCPTTVALPKNLSKADWLLGLEREYARYYGYNGAYPDLNNKLETHGTHAKAYKPEELPSFCSIQEAAGKAVPVDPANAYPLNRFGNPNDYCVFGDGGSCVGFKVDLKDENGNTLGNALPGPAYAKPEDLNNLSATNLFVSNKGGSLSSTRIDNFYWCPTKAYVKRDLPMPNKNYTGEVYLVPMEEQEQKGKMVYGQGEVGIIRTPGQEHFTSLDPESIPDISKKIIDGVKSEINIDPLPDHIQDIETGSGVSGDVNMVDFNV